MSPSDLLEDTPESECDEKFLEEFENAWKDFLSNRPFRCKRFDHIIDLQTQLMTLKQDNSKMVKDFQKQIKFLDRGKTVSEKEFSEKIQGVLQEEKRMKDAVNERIESVKWLQALQEQTLPWFHFMRELDRLAEVHHKNDEASPSANKVSRPSARAKFLAAGVSRAESPSQHQLGECLVDNALLTTQVQMLHREVERCQTLMEINETTICKFLAKNNIWNILETKEIEKYCDKKSYADNV